MTLVNRLIRQRCAIVEARQVWGPDARYSNKPVPRGEPELHVRHLERFPIGEAYVRQGERLAGLLGAKSELGGATLYVDATGCGRPVLELLQRDLPGAKG